MILSGFVVLCSPQGQRFC
ncbi:BgTH12-03909 [Blumeria graminis f. sp. triticale]|uniref:Bgt-51061 n=2 Tax=Blumeria graminis TaxID=34373 RepID=A0A9X9L8X7_BLUGR|nr:BgTH12-03909 [Blumeria graminis f. sp. triticale]VCU39964.1 Bgt-51061 [Blumeria graminis f. sp. tritici]